MHSEPLQYVIEGQTLSQKFKAVKYLVLLFSLLSLSRCGTGKEAVIATAISHPIRVVGLKEPQESIAMDGFGAACVKSFQGRVSCWGYDFQLGRSKDYLTTPHVLPSITNVREIGSGHVIYLVDENFHIFQGHGLTFDPVSNTTGTPLWKLANEGESSCILLEGGMEACSDRGYFEVITTTPPRVIQIAGHPFAPSSIGVALFENGDVYCAYSYWCSAQFHPNDEDAPQSDHVGLMVGLPAAKYVATACAIGKDGLVYCWGQNGYGELGTGRKEWFDGTFRPVLNVVDAVKVQSGDAQHRCALESDGDLWCWGYSSFGETGLGHPPKNPFPSKSCDQMRDIENRWLPHDPNNWNCEGVYTPIRVLRGVKDFALNSTNTCAVKTDGSVWCWGLQRKGRLGNGVDLP